MKYLFFILLMLFSTTAYSFEKMNGNRLVLLTSIEAYNHNEDEQMKLIKSRAKNICRLIHKVVQDFSFEKITQEYIPEKNDDKNIILRKEIQFFKIPLNDFLHPVTEDELIVQYNGGKAAIQLLFLGLLPITKFGHAVVLKDITCVDESMIDEFVLE